MSHPTLFKQGWTETALLAGFLRRDRVALRASLVLFAVTLGIIMLYVVAGFWDEQSGLAHIIRHNFNLGLDDVFSENFGHGLSFLVAVLMLMSFFEVRSRAMVFLSALYGFIWFDDSSKYHERAGEKIGAAFDIPVSFGLGPQEYGELLAWSIAGVVMALIFVWFWRGRRPGDLGAVVPFLMCFGLLVVCGVVVDMLHIALPPGFDEAASVIEDGGEMLAIAASAALALGLSRNVVAYYRAIAAPDEAA